MDTLYSKAVAQSKRIYPQALISSKKIHWFNVVNAEPEYITLKHTYSLMNPHDIDKISSRTVKNLLNFNCEMCTTRDQIISTKLSFDNFLIPDGRESFVPYRIGEYTYVMYASIPQKFPNHVILTTSSHINCYVLPLEKNIFFGYMETLQKINDKFPKVKGIFSGSYGIQNNWHSHFDLTDMDISPISEIKDYISSVTQFPYETSFRNPEINFNGQVILSKNLGDLYEKVSSYFFTGLFRDVDARATCGIFFTEGDTFGALIFVVVNENKLSIEDKNMFIDYTNFTINVAGEKIFEIPKEKIISEIKNKNVYRNLLNAHGVNYISIINGQIAKTANIAMIPCEFLQYLILNGKDNTVCSDLKSSIESFWNNPTMKSCLKPGCSSSKRALFNFIISLYVVCNKIEGKSVYSLMKEDKNLFQAAVYIELSKLSDKYKIKDDTYMYFQGPIANTILLNTSKNLLLRSLIDDKRTIDVQKLDKVDPQKINSWISYASNRIGDKSVGGILTKNNLSSSPDSLIVLKLNKEIRHPAEFIYEYTVGIILNDLRKKIPNITLTLGGFTCPGRVKETKVNLGGGKYEYELDMMINKLCQSDPLPGTIETDFQYIVLEFIKGKTLGGYIKDLSNSTEDVKKLRFDLLSIFCQIFASLEYAHSKTGFTHYDFHTGNVMIYNFSQESWWQDRMRLLFRSLGTRLPTSIKPIFEYHIGSQILKVPAKVLTVIIDFGKSHVDGIKEYPPAPTAEYLKMSGFTTSKSYPQRDIFTLLYHSFILIIESRPDLLVDNLGDIIDSDFSKFYIDFFNAFSDVFVKMTSPVDFIKNIYQESQKVPSPQRLGTIIGLTRKYRGDSKTHFIYLPLDYSNNNGFFTPGEVSKKIFSYLQKDYVPNVKLKWGDLPPAKIGFVDIFREVDTKYSKILKSKFEF